MQSFRYIFFLFALTVFVQSLQANNHEVAYELASLEQMHAIEEQIFQKGQPSISAQDRYQESYQERNLIEPVMQIEYLSIENQEMEHRLELEIETLVGSLQQILQKQRWNKYQSFAVSLPEDSTPLLFSTAVAATGTGFSQGQVVPVRSTGIRLDQNTGKDALASGSGLWRIPAWIELLYHSFRQGYAGDSGKDPISFFLLLPVPVLFLFFLNHLPSFLSFAAFLLKGKPALLILYFLQQILQRNSFTYREGLHAL